jgi:hypothetical protein
MEPSENKDKRRDSFYLRIDIKKDQSLYDWSFFFIINVMQLLIKKLKLVFLSQQY